MLRLGAVGDARLLVVGEDEVVRAGARALHAVEVVGADQAEVRAAAVLHGARVVVGDLPQRVVDVDVVRPVRGIAQHLVMAKKFLDTDF